MQYPASTTLSFLVLFSASSLARHEAPPEFLLNQIDVLTQSLMDDQKIPGLSLALAVEGRLVYAKGFGFADLENSVAATDTTVYRTASIAKPMTATAVLELVEEGKIDLDESVRTYCPSFPEKKWEVTVRQLLGHLGGVRHYNAPGEASGTAHFTSVEEALQTFKEDPLLHQPGTKYQYTTYGYSLLGCAVEGASGLIFHDYMATRVFGPAGMIQTRTDHHYALIPHRARGYLRIDPEDLENSGEALQGVRAGVVLNAALHDTSMKVPGGGLVSTAPDLVRFALAVRAGTLVRPTTLEQMWTVQQTSEGEATGYGLGWGIAEDAESGKKWIAHSGGQAGVRTQLRFEPEEGTVIAVMCNLQGANLQPILDGIQRLLKESIAVAVDAP